MLHYVRLLCIFFVLLLFVAFTGCDKKTSGPSNGNTQLEIDNKKGTIRISGAWALYPMMVKWGEEYRKINPNVRIDISAGGAGKGIADALAGLTDIGMVSRDIKQEETRQGAIFVSVVKDAVFPTINKNNPVLNKIINVKGIKKNAFIDLWINGNAITWGTLADTDSNHKVQVYTRSDSCGAAETWANYLGGKKQEDLKGIGVYGDPGIADAIKKDNAGIGYNNLNYAFDTKTGLPVEGIQVVPVDVNDNGRVDPEEDIRTKEKAIKAVMSGVYPSPPARDLYLVTKEYFKEPGKSFVKWILTDGQKFVDEVGYIKLNNQQLKKSILNIEK